MRRVVYTTNAIESLNARIRQAARRHGQFPNDRAFEMLTHNAVTEYSALTEGGWWIATDMPVTESTIQPRSPSKPRFRSRLTAFPLDLRRFRGLKYPETAAGMSPDGRPIVQFRAVT